MLVVCAQRRFLVACFALLALCSIFCLAQSAEVREFSGPSRDRLVSHLKSEIINGKLNKLLDKQNLEDVGTRKRMEGDVLDTYGTFLIEEYERLKGNPKVPTNGCTRKLNTIGHDCLQP